ncbi:MAG: M56 family metallopeptidase [Clostridiales bacterium]|jgi:beta-lactamase regulating signal transducer with metallopeptidase domain|nr:M56 family metallopeptidase [Clostridiales bacterium]
MLHGIFYIAINMSAAASVAMAALFLARLVKPVPRRIIYPLWLIALFRMIIPFAPGTSWSLFNFTGGLVKRTVSIESLFGKGLFAPKNLMVINALGAASSYSPIEYKTESLRRIFEIGSQVWITVAAAAFLTVIALYAFTQKELKKAVRIRDGLYRCDMLLSPMLVGVLRPKVIIPQNLDPDSLEGQMALAHEAVHQRRLDNLWRVVAVFTCCLHWFNPLAWLSLKAFFADMELSCDEAAIKKLGEGKRKAYASALLRFAEGKRTLVSSAFGCSGVRVRIVNILNYKKLTILGSVASALFLLAIAAALATNPELGR